uniref:Si:dkeyp-47f9.4 n=1 Tax=Takifugu rubripes TaxID=31033 RepID=A0A674MV20_TAKRU
MTKEDVSEDVKGDSVLGWSSSHQRPVIHQVASAPMPSDCEFSFFDPSDPQCREVLLDPRTTIPELFAVLRQWVPQVQRNICVIGHEILKRGCGVNDRDGLTDMSLLHYCCKAGAQGIGDVDAAVDFARQLLALGADPNLRSRWTNMRALHYAAYFDVPQLIQVVLQASQPGEVDATCSDFDFGTALHIAASNLCLSAVKCLLELGANPAFRNEKGHCPADVVPDPLDMPLEMADGAAVASELRTLLRRALPRLSSPLPFAPQAQSPPALSEKAKVQLASMGVRIGDSVVIAGQKVGTLRFCGSTEFSAGLWAGVELDKPEGKNDGSVAGVQYFTCRMKYGIFAPLSKISKAADRNKSCGTRTATPVRPPRRVPAKFKTGVSQSLSSSSSSLDSRHGPSAQPHPLPRQRLPPRPRRHRVLLNPRTTAPPAFSSSADRASLVPADNRSRTPSASSSTCGGPEVRPGERVLVAGQRTGVVKFCGKTNFAPGLWLGIKLDKPSGKNDGSVGGVRYFSCPPKHGVFAPPSRVQRYNPSQLQHVVGHRLSETHQQKSPGDEVCFRLILCWCLIVDFGAHTDSYNVFFFFFPNKRSHSNLQSQRWSTLGNTAGSAPVSDSQVRLHVGMQVLLTSANEMAFLRYLGTADFAPGLWLGLELQSPKGKNDGSVGGRRYFSCRPGHGVMVRPSRVTYRGINGARLLNDGH